MKKIKKNYRIKYILIGIAISSFSLLAFTALDDGHNFEISKSLDIYTTLLRELDIYYVDEIDVGKLNKDGIDAMLKSLDPYTVFIPDSKIEDYKFMQTGQYAGIGIVVHQEKGKIIISEVYKNAPGDKAGLKVGDIILKIDDFSISNKPISEIDKFMQGSPNSKVSLQIQRPGSNKIENYNMQREIIKLDNVPYYAVIEDNIGYISMNSFTPNAAQEILNAYKDLKEKGIEALIIDLRNNPGGLLIEAVRIVNLFVKRGEKVVSTKGKAEQWDTDFFALEQATDLDIPLAIVVNSHSASASEIVAGALQDLDRAVVIGERTFGKGLVQTTRPLSYNSLLKITTAKYYIPSGRCIQALDYSHRKADGSVGRLPDSLISEFETKNGRKVFDGGGIQPDIEIKINAESNIKKALINQYIIFNFITQYYLNNEVPKTINDVKIDDKMFDEFKNFAEQENLKYQTKREKMFNKLVETAKAERHYTENKAEFDALQEKLKTDQKKDIELFKEEIIQEMTYEIIQRYFYRKGQLQYAVEHSPEIETAKNILKNKAKYNKILGK